MKCIECGTTKKLQTHHISYEPKTIEVRCVMCHFKIHNCKHGVGSARGMIITEMHMVISARLPKGLKILMDKLVASSASYINAGDFTRVAVKEYIQREAPELYQELFKEDKK